MLLRRDLPRGTLRDACEDCQENADMGVISIDDDFPNDAHPNCRCDIAPIWRK